MDVESSRSKFKWQLEPDPPQQERAAEESSSPEPSFTRSRFSFSISRSSRLSDVERTMVKRGLQSVLPNEDVALNKQDSFESSIRDDEHSEEQMAPYLKKKSLILECNLE